MEVNCISLITYRKDGKAEKISPRVISESINVKTHRVETRQRKKLHVTKGLKYPINPTEEVWGFEGEKKGGLRTFQTFPKKRTVVKLGIVGAVKEKKGVVGVIGGKRGLHGGDDLDLGNVLRH